MLMSILCTQTVSCWVESRLFPLTKSFIHFQEISLQLTYWEKGNGISNYSLQKCFAFTTFYKEVMAVLFVLIQ